MVAWLTGCGLLPDVKDETAGWSAEKLYSNAHDAMLEGNYTRATKLFETLESRYPYGRYAQQAILEGAYCELARERARPPPIAGVRPLHPHLSEPPERRLRVLPEGPRLLPRGPGPVRLRVRARPRPSAIPSDARVVRGVQGARRRTSRRAATRRTPPTRMRYLTNALGDVRGARRAATTTTAAPTSPRRAARRRRCSTIREHGVERATRSTCSSKSYDKLGLVAARATTRARILASARSRQQRLRSPACRRPKPWWKFW